MPERYRYGIVAGIGSALIFVLAAVAPGLQTFAAVLPLPLVVAGLSQGFRTGAIAIVTCAVLIAVLFFDPLGGFGFIVLFGLPLGLMIYLALLGRSVDAEDESATLDWYPVGRVLAWVATWIAGLFVLTYVMALGADGGLHGIVRRAVGAFIAENPQVLDQIRAQFEAGGGPLKAEDIESLAGFVLPGLLGVSLLLVLGGNFLAGYYLSRKAGIGIRPVLGLKEIQVPEFLALALLVCVAATFFGGDILFVGGSLAAILFVPFVVVGLSVVHTLTQGQAAQSLFLLAFYAIFFLIGPVIFMVGGLGVAEQWLNIRGKLQRVTDK